MKKIELYSNNNLYLQEILNKGRGIFSSKEITKDTVLETCPCIIFSDVEAILIDKTNLYNYYFSAHFLSKDEARELNIGDQDKAGLIACGNLGFCNHSEEPNAYIKKQVINGHVYFTLIAKRHIPAHEEICISYGMVWFEMN